MNFCVVGYKYHIAVNARLLLKDRLEGIGNFAHETLYRMALLNPDTHFTFLFDRQYAPEFIYASNVTPVVLFPQARHPFLYLWWFEWSVAQWLNTNKPDLFLSPDGYGVLRSSVPQLLVIHDIAYEHYPAHVGKLQLWYYQYFMPRFATHATRIATVSAFSKRDICKQYHIEEQKIDVVPNAVKTIFTPIDDAAKEAMRKKYTAGAAYFICVGSVNPRKNVANILQAFEAFKQQTGSNMKLLIAGAKGWQTGEIFDTHNRMQHKAEVYFTGRLSDSELAQVTAAADVMLYPSLFEGFGVPPLEAMACGVPVITSNISSLPEVAGDAALYVSPENVQDLTAKMKALIANEHLKTDLIQKGYIRYKQYTWDSSAKLLWNSCIKTLTK